MKITSVLLTCEHGGFEVPEEYASLFEGSEELLKSHHGWDPGALDLAFSLSETLNAQLYYSDITRLLVELNRSEHHPALFSPLTKQSPDMVKKSILGTYYHPFRTRVFKHISQVVQEGGFVLHLSVHSFTPELEGKVRNADVGILYDPGREYERTIAGNIAMGLKGMDSSFRVRMNYPYRGKSDGHATFLRKKFGSAEYAGLELEVNQKLLVPGGRGDRDKSGDPLIPDVPGNQVLPAEQGNGNIQHEQNSRQIHFLIGESVKAAIDSFTGISAETIY